MSDIPNTLFIERAIAPKKPVRTMTAIRHKAVVDALLRNNGSPVAAARELGISRTQMFYYRKQLGLI